jgi:hypothetical protein
MEGTVTRSYDVSHLTRTCDVCGEFERHVNQRVIDQYEAFEADPPSALDWGALDRTRKLVVAERVARHGRSVESLAGDRREPDIEADEAADAGGTGTDPEGTDEDGSETEGAHEAAAEATDGAGGDERGSPAAVDDEDPTASEVSGGNDHEVGDDPATGADTG